MKKNNNMATKEMWADAGNDREKIVALAKLAPEFTLEEVGIEPGPTVARGFAQFKEYINKNGRPRAEDPRISVSIRIPQSCAEKLRSTGPGWQTRMGDYIVNGVKRGALNAQ